MVVNVKVKPSRATLMKPLEFHEIISSLRNGSKPRSHQADNLISQLKDEGVEILNSQLLRQTVVVWIWCRSQTALKHTHILYESNQLRDVFFGIANIRPPATEFNQSKMLNIDRNHFKKTAGKLSIHDTQNIACVMKIVTMIEMVKRLNRVFREITSLREVEQILF